MIVLKNYCDLAADMPFDLYDFVETTVEHERVRLFQTLMRLEPYLWAHDDAGLAAGKHMDQVTQSDAEFAALLHKEEEAALK